MSTYAQVEHVEALWPRPFAPSELDHVQHLVDRAERLVESRVDVGARLLGGRTTVDNVRDAIVGIVLRRMSNPQGIRSQTTGPFSQVIDQTVASGRLELTWEERRLLGMSAAASTVTTVDPAMPGVTRSVVSNWGDS